jgi:hypothetical protein
MVVKMPNSYRKKYHSAIALNSNSRIFPNTVSPILLLALCLYTTRAASAQQIPTNITFTPKLTQRPTTPPPTRLSAAGNRISLNGRTLAGAWIQQPGTANQLTTHLSDGFLRQLIGVDLLSSSNPVQQPIEWFSSDTKPLTLTARLFGAYRYLDITNFSQAAGWQIQANGNTLVIVTPTATVKNILQPPASNRITVDLDRPTPWQVTQGLPIAAPQDPDTLTPQVSQLPNREWKITLDGIADPSLLQRYTPLPPISPPIPIPNQLKQLPPVTTPESLVRKVEVVKNQTIISLSVPFGQAPRINTVANPHRLEIEIRPDALQERNITWAQGLQWRQRFVNLGTERFPVVWLEINPRTTGLKLKPIVSNSNASVGTAPLIQIAQQSLAVAAINAGYFNRNNRLPLGALRRDNQWLSGPILNRGAIAWNDAGQFYLGRLALTETLTAANNLRWPILFLNSGYVQRGISRYTPAWGATYTPLTDNEIILVVQQNQITNQLPGGKAGATNLAIPPDGYLLTLRGNAVSSAAQLPIGTTVNITSTATPADFNRYPHIVAAGPLLVQNRQIVLDAKSEAFGNAFISAKAIRSGICTTNTGNLMIAAVHNRAGGAGPTLAEHARLMQLLGCVDALNLDGGSSTSLYLGGQLLDRSPSTAARVHNGIGIFLQQR